MGCMHTQLCKVIRIWLISGLWRRRRRGEGALCRLAGMHGQWRRWGEHFSAGDHFSPGDQIWRTRRGMPLWRRRGRGHDRDNSPGRESRGRVVWAPVPPCMSYTRLGMACHVYLQDHRSHSPSLPSAAFIYRRSKNQRAASWSRNS
jgi:hypothetical protein